jgi:hypothetical protein
LREDHFFLESEFIAHFYFGGIASFDLALNEGNKIGILRKQAAAAV